MEEEEEEEEEQEVQARKRQRTGVGEGMMSSVWKKLFQSLSWLRTSSSSSSSRIGSSRVEETTTIACRGAASSVMEESSSMMIAQRIKQVVEDWRVQAVELEKERALVVDMEKKLSSGRDCLRHLTQQLEAEREVNKILQAKFCRSRYELIQNEHKYILSAGKMQQKIHDMSLELKNCTKDKEFLQSEAEKGRRYCKDMQRELRKCRHSLTELKMVQRQQQQQMDTEEEQRGGRRPYAHKKKQQRLQENHRALKKRFREEESEEQQNAAAERRTKGRGDLSASQERRIDTKLLSQEPSSPADKRVTKAAASGEQRP